MSEVFSVNGGKYHYPCLGVSGVTPWTPVVALCGITVTPLNYFATVADANSWTGGKLSQYICRRCEKEMQRRLEHLRQELRAERISYGEIAELQSLVNYIDRRDTELLEACGTLER